MEDNYDQLFEDWNDYEWEKAQLIGVTNERLYEEIYNFTNEDGFGYEEHLVDGSDVWDKITEQHKNGKIDDRYREWLEAFHIYLFAN